MTRKENKEKRRKYVKKKMADEENERSLRELGVEILGAGDLPG